MTAEERDASGFRGIELGCSILKGGHGLKESAEVVFRNAGDQVRFYFVDRIFYSPMDPPAQRR